MAAVRRAQSASDAMDEAFADFVGINHTDARCLDLIDQSGRLTAGELSRSVGLTTGAVTAVVDRLEAAGLVRRARDTKDRRKVYIEPTPEAIRLGSEIYGPLASAGLPYLRHLSDDQILTITQFLETSATINLEHAQTVRKMSAGGKVSLRRRLEQARQIKAEAKTLAKAIKADLKALAGGEHHRVRDSEGEWTDI